MKRIVISQPMFFPWVGLFEQIRLCDVFVHYDDVQLPQGRSFMSRVQIKTHKGPQWLTAPIMRSEKQLIKDVVLDNAQLWRREHLRTLAMNYARAPFCADMLSLVESIYTRDIASLSELNIFATETIAHYFGLGRQFLRSSELHISSSSSERLLKIMLKLEGDVYITGHGAKNYLDHELFEKNGMSVEYMNYCRTPYPQLHGEFTPFVSILDLIANVGPEGIKYINSGTVSWREFINE